MDAQRERDEAQARERALEIRRHRAVEREKAKRFLVAFAIVAVAVGVFLYGWHFLHEFQNWHINFGGMH